MKQIECRGQPYDLGFQHGSSAQVEIERCIAFYSKVFIKNSNLNWNQVQETAARFQQSIRANWPQYYEELTGIADGSKRNILDIIALNVRTEIAFGLFSDGCTSVYWKTKEKVFLGQNWDWMEEQKENLLLLTIYPESSGLPVIKMVTEAGMIGKIGFNSVGVGVCFNAIRAKGLDNKRMPVHLGLRLALESVCAQEAVARVRSNGMASSAHMLIGDKTNAIGLEFTHSTFAELQPNSHNRIIHSNHLLVEHKGAQEPPWLEDSPVRVERMTSLATNLAATGGEPTLEEFSALFEDEENPPGAICRKQEGESTTATLFNIVMELNEKRAVVRLGRPCAPEEVIHLSFDD